MEACKKINAPAYCNICTVPYEYCQWSGTWEACKNELKIDHPDLFSRLYPDTISLAALTIVDGVEVVKDTTDVIAVEEVKVTKKKNKPVILKKVSRSKRKCSILIQGLDAYGTSSFNHSIIMIGVDLKKTSKIFSNKFACGSAVSKVDGGGEEIVVQGDVQDEIFEFILENFPNVLEDDIQMISK